MYKVTSYDIEESQLPDNQQQLFVILVADSR